MAGKDNLTAVLYGIEDIRLEQRSIPVPKDNRDRVAIEPGVGCHICELCKEEDYHLCIDVMFCATPPVDGNLSRYYVHDADFCYKFTRQCQS